MTGRIDGWQLPETIIIIMIVIVGRNILETNESAQHVV